MDDGLDGDIFNIRQLLEAANVSIDNPLPRAADRPRLGETRRHDFPGKNSSVRFEGLTLLVTVVYDSDTYLEWDHTTYDYRVDVYTDFEAKSETIDLINETYRVVEDLHGLQILFAQRGVLRKFDLYQLMLCLATSLASIWVASMLANFFLLYLSPLSKDYRLFVRSYSPDFNPKSRRRDSNPLEPTECASRG